MNIDTRIAIQRVMVKGLWILACQHDKIEPESKFVVMREENPYLMRYNQAIAALMYLQGLRKENRS